MSAPMTIDEMKTLVAKTREHETVWGYAYGMNSDYMDSEHLIEIKTDSLKTGSFGFYYEWGFPGPDYTFFGYEDYGKSWAFTKEELNPLTEVEG